MPLGGKNSTIEPRKECRAAEAALRVVLGESVSARDSRPSSARRLERTSSLSWQEFSKERRSVDCVRFSPCANSPKRFRNLRVLPCYPSSTSIQHHRSRNSKRCSLELSKSSSLSRSCQLTRPCSSVFSLRRNWIISHVISALDVAGYIARYRRCQASVWNYGQRKRTADAAFRHLLYRENLTNRLHVIKVGDGTSSNTDSRRRYWARGF